MHQSLISQIFVSEYNFKGNVLSKASQFLLGSNLSTLQEGFNDVKIAPEHNVWSAGYMKSPDT